MFYVATETNLKKKYIDFYYHSAIVKSFQNIY